MSDERTRVVEMRAITISRQYGSGGGEVAARLAERLGWQLIDHHIVAEVAVAMGITEEEAKARDERVERIVTHVLSAMGHAAAEAAVAVPSTSVIADDAYYEAVRNAVEMAVNVGRVVIVGRGGQVLLADRRDVLHVRVVAPLQQRLAYVMRREGLNEEQARDRLQMKDRDRMRYLQVQHHRNPDDPLSYDLVVNTGVLDLDALVDLIRLALVRKGRRLGAPEWQLGPGMGPYRGHPGDLRSKAMKDGQ
ncbi:MAG TPA: cytidylate kinase-like family protein [Ktedonobacterales bacterium]